MTRYSVEPRDWTFVKGYGFLSFAENMGKNIGKNISKSLSGKHNKKPIYHAKQSATDALKNSPKRVIEKTAEATGDLIGNKIANKIIKVSKNSQQVNLVINENDKEIPKERHMSSEEREEVIDSFRLKY